MKKNLKICMLFQEGFSLHSGILKHAGKFLNSKIFLVHLKENLEIKLTKDLHGKIMRKFNFVLQKSKS